MGGEGYLFFAKNKKAERYERLLGGGERPLHLLRKAEERGEAHLYSYVYMPRCLSRDRNVRSRFHHRTKGRLRVYTTETSYKTLVVPVGATSIEVCEVLAPKLDLMAADSIALAFRDPSGTGM